MKTQLNTWLTKQLGARYETKKKSILDMDKFYHPPSYLENKTD